MSVVLFAGAAWFGAIVAQFMIIRALRTASSTTAAAGAMAAVSALLLLGVGLWAAVAGLVVVSIGDAGGWMAASALVVPPMIALGIGRRMLRAPSGRMTAESGTDLGPAAPAVASGLSWVTVAVVAGTSLVLGLLGLLLDETHDQRLEVWPLVAVPVVLATTWLTGRITVRAVAASASAHPDPGSADRPTNPDTRMLRDVVAVSVLFAIGVAACLAVLAFVLLGPGAGSVPDGPVLGPPSPS